MRVGVNGAAGRMGATVCAAVLKEPGLELVAAVDPQGAGVTVPGSGGSVVPAGTGAPAGSAAPVGSGGAVGPRGASAPVAAGVVIASSSEAFVEAGAEVVVDFTAAEAAMGLLRFCAGHGLHAVSGTTGLGEKDVIELRDLFGGSGAIGAGPNCVWAPNFAIGAVLMMKMAEIAAPYIEGAEIIELHHDGKVDAPSGTSIETARMIAAARAAAAAGPLSGDPTRRETIAGTRGGVGEGSIPIHSVRLPGLVAHQEVIFGILGQVLTIRHDSIDRSSFMPGVLAAVKAVPARPGLTVGLAAVIGL